DTLRLFLLTIHGTKQQEAEEKTERVHRYERTYGAFERSFTLPASVEPNDIRANYDNGVLTLTLPKSEKAKPRQIEVQVGNRETAQHGELADMGHGVRERPLQQLFSGNRARRAARQQLAHRLDHIVEARHFFFEGGQRIGLHRIRSALKQRTYVTHQRRHVAQQFDWRADAVAGAEGRIVLGSAAQRFLRAVGDGGEEM